MKEEKKRQRGRKTAARLKRPGGSAEDIKCAEAQ